MTLGIVTDSKANSDVLYKLRTEIVLMSARKQYDNFATADIGLRLSEI